LKAGVLAVIPFLPDVGGFKLLFTFFLPQTPSVKSGENTFFPIGGGKGYFLFPALSTPSSEFKSSWENGTDKDTRSPFGRGNPFPFFLLFCSPPSPYLGLVRTRRIKA